jgi:hypothetical protein
MGGERDESQNRCRPVATSLVDTVRDALNSSRDVLWLMSSESEIAERSEESSTVRDVVRTVSPAYRGRFDGEMHSIGLLYAALLAILFVPLLPFVVVIWVAWRVAGAVRSFAGEDESAESSGSARRRRGRAA